MEKSRPSRKDSVDLVSKIETETCKCFSFRTLVCGALLWVLSFNVATVSYATYLLIAKENKDQNAEDSQLVYQIVMGISRLTVVIHLILTICSIVGVAKNVYKLILPFLFFSWIQFGQYFALVVYAIVKQKYVTAGVSVGYLVILALGYACSYKYFKQLRMQHKSKFSVANLGHDEEHGGQ